MEARVREFAHLVYNELGPGFSENAYCKALAVCLQEIGVVCQSEVALPVVFKGVQITTLRCDLVVDGLVIEVKTINTLNNNHRSQLQCYLRHMPFQTGLLINFGPLQVDMESIFIR
jgi:GxxExxY protein